MFITRLSYLSVVCLLGDTVVWCAPTDKPNVIGCNRQITRPMSVCVLQQPVTRTDRTTGKQVQTCLLQPSALQIKEDFPE
ncbi:hypothetical protein [Bacteroides cellulosilyticus]|uniref:hypothetical protein n=1 Tax=Bacteroides cellulosilyticus TaxID=246787 RepID=UPI001269168D|nr:hypothetical protein [Bacteroides cellulosilyticus]